MKWGKVQARLIAEWLTWTRGIDGGAVGRLLVFVHCCSAEAGPIAGERQDISFMINYESLLN
jgi:hypothetical protein